MILSRTRVAQAVSVGAFLAIGAVVGYTVAAVHPTLVSLAVMIPLVIISLATAELGWRK